MQLAETTACNPSHQRTAAQCPRLPTNSESQRHPGRGIVLLDSLFDSLDFVKLVLDEKDAEMARLAVLVQASRSFIPHLPGSPSCSARCARGAHYPKSPKSPCSRRS
jgi:hypothetical protein